MLLPSFIRCFRDPFWKARHAAVQAVMATLRFAEVEEMVTKLVPALAPLCLDPFRWRPFPFLPTSSRMLPPPPPPPLSLSLPNPQLLLFHFLQSRA